MSNKHVEVLWQTAAVLRESAKQHRANGDTGHSHMCDEQAVEIDAAIAALSAPQPPAEAQAQGDGEAKVCDYVGWQRCDMCVQKLAYPPITAPPSAPVGAEELVSRAISQGKRLQWSAVMDTLERLRGTLALAQQPAAVDGLNDWRAAFVAERAMRYREGGMAIEQARIHAETDAARIDALAAQQGGSDNDR